jgi:hypothetical protein
LSVLVFDALCLLLSNDGQLKGERSRKRNFEKVIAFEIGDGDRA